MKGEQDNAREQQVVRRRSLLLIAGAFVLVAGGVALGLDRAPAHVADRQEDAASADVSLPERDTAGDRKDEPAEESEERSAPEEPGTKQVEMSVERLQEGSGSAAQAGQLLSVHYRGALEDGTEFDSSYRRGEPFSFVLGAGQVIRGWDLGLRGMQEGEARRLVIPPELAYGSRELSGIPAGSTLVFEVRLLDIREP